MSEKPWAKFIVGQFGAVAGILFVFGLLVMSATWVVWAFTLLRDMLFPQ